MIRAVEIFKDPNNVCKCIMALLSFNVSIEKIDQVISVMESFWKVTIFIKSISVNFSKFLRAPFLQNTSGGCFWSYINAINQAVWNLWYWLWGLTRLYIWFFVDFRSWKVIVAINNEICVNKKKGDAISLSGHLVK